MKHFIYHKKDGTSKERFVVELHPISNTMLAIDLTEYDENERQELEDAIEYLKQDFLSNLYDLGVGSNFRKFKSDRIEEIDNV